MSPFGGLWRQQHTTKEKQMSMNTHLDVLIPVLQQVFMVFHLDTAPPDTECVCEVCAVKTAIITLVLTKTRALFPIIESMNNHGNPDLAIEELGELFLKVTGVTMDEGRRQVVLTSRR
jgi:hypothetical protein